MSDAEIKMRVDEIESTLVKSCLSTGVLKDTTPLLQAKERLQRQCSHSMSEKNENGVLKCCFCRKVL